MHASSTPGKFTPPTPRRNLGGLQRHLALLLMVAFAGYPLASSRAATFTWDGDPGGDNIFVPGNPGQTKAYWNNLSGGNFTSWVNDPGSLPGLDDVVVFADAFHTGTDINLRGDRAARELRFNRRHSDGINFYNGRPNGDSSLSIRSGDITFQHTSGTNEVTFWRVPVFFHEQGLIRGESALGVVRFDAGLHAPSGVRIGDNARANFTSFVSSPNLYIDAGRASFGIHGADTSGGSFTGSTIVVGNGVGAANSARLDLSTDTAAFTERSVQVQSDGLVWISGDPGRNSYEFTGGTARLYETRRNLPVLSVKASPGLVSGEPLARPAVIESQISDFSGTYYGVDLSGDHVAFDMRAAHGVSDALRVTMRLHNGSVHKIGDGTLVLAGQNVVHEFSSAVIDEGTIAMVRPWQAPAAVSPTLQIGNGSGGVGVFESRGDNVIDDRAAITIYSDGILRTGGYEETVSNVTLRGGSIDTRFDVFGEQLTGTITLSNAIHVDGTQQSAIRGNAELAAGGVTLNVADAASGTDLLIDATLTGEQLVKQGAGTVRLAGTSFHSFFDVENTHAGTTVTAGTLELAKPAGSSAVGNDLIVGTQGQANGPTVIWDASDQVHDDVQVKLRSGILNLNGHTERIRGINASGSGWMSVATGGAGGLLELNGPSTSFAGAQVLLAGNYALGGGTRTFDARGGSGQDPDFTNWRFFGATLNDGTFRKIGAGRVELASVTGDAVLDIAAGSVRVNGTTLGGLTGSGNLQLAGGFTVDQTAGTSTFSGVISGNGNFTKTGAGGLRLSGTQDNTATGNIVVNGGTLFLNRYGATTVPGTLTINSGGRVVAEQTLQFEASGHVAINGGELDLNSFDQVVGKVVANEGTVKNGVLGATQGVQLHNAVTDNVTLLITAGGLQVTGTSTVEAIGYVTENSKFESDAVLRVGSMVNHPGPDLTFSDTLQLYHGSTLELFPHIADDDPLVRVEGGLLVGDPKIQVGAFARLTGMDGVATVDLSQNDPLAAGVYNLIDFSAAPFAVPGVEDSLFASLEHFDTIAPPDTPGSFQITDNVLQFVSEGPPMLLGDYNNDGVIDAADYTVWRNNLGSDTQLPNDDTPGVGPDDYERWKNHFGQSANAASLTSTAVPEPATAVLLAVAAGMAAVWQQRRHPRGDHRG